MSRPELAGPAELYYNDSRAAQYTTNSRVITIQTEMAERALALLNFGDDNPRLIMDLGCGSGLSGQVLSEAGHAWVGLDISPSMLEIAQSSGAEGDLCLADMGQGFGFRTGVFDGVISVSALQWLFYSVRTDHNARKRLKYFFTCLYKCLRRGARAVLQLYPESAEQLELITTISLRAGFSGGLVVDYPNSRKARKHYLCLFAGLDTAKPLLRGLGVGASAGAGAEEDEDEEVPATHVSVMGRARTKPHKKTRSAFKDRDWVLKKKEMQRKQGKEVRPDSKYTARRRPTLV